MQINRNNYEELFLMYADDELSAIERKMVDAFIQQNPDLKAELDLLLDTVSESDEHILFDDKEKLMAVNGFREEELLTYLDGEGGPEVTAAIEKGIKENEDTQQQVALLEKLYFKPDTSVIYPRKEVLYRRARITKMDWWKIAVAASLLLLVSAWMFFYKEEADIEKPLAVADTLRPEPLRGINPQATPADTTPVKNVVIAPLQYVKASKQADEPKKDETPVAASQLKEPVPVSQPDRKIAEGVRASQVNEVERIAVPVAQAPANDIKGTAKETPVVQTVNEMAIQAAVTEAPVKEKKNSLLKKIGKKIGDRALDILSDDGEDIHVAGFAINVRK
ncbi:MAG TPA: hypothetical protein PKE30_05105 [Niabella sp.]|nr:hypothetical protein [Niabella sp.]